MESITSFGFLYAGNVLALDPGEYFSSPTNAAGGTCRNNPFGGPAQTQMTVPTKDPKEDFLGVGSELHSSLA